MRRTVSIRLFALVVAAGSLTAIPLSSPSSAAAAGASCSKLVSPAPVTVKGVAMSHSTVSGCTPLSATGGSGTSVTNLKTFVSTTTWAGGKGTTIEKVTYKTGPKASKCPSGTYLIVSTAVVTGGSGAALQVITKGQKGAASVCVNSKTSAASLEPGTKYVF